MENGGTHLTTLHYLYDTNVEDSLEENEGESFEDENFDDEKDKEEQTKEDDTISQTVEKEGDIEFQDQEESHPPHFSTNNIVSRFSEEYSQVLDSSSNEEEEEEEQLLDDFETINEEDIQESRALLSKNSLSKSTVFWSIVGTLFENVSSSIEQVIPLQLLGSSLYSTAFESGVSLSASSMKFFQHYARSLLLDGF